jgi:hypothetical protein
MAEGMTAAKGTDDGPLGFATQAAAHGSQHAEASPRSASRVTMPAWRSTDRDRLANPRLNKLASKIS